MTGHLVLSTLHTNDAPGAITRLTDMNIEPFLITSTIEGVLAQRLVRTICTGCREPYMPPEELLMDLGVTLEMTQGMTFYTGKGCVDCNFSGYRGRIGIFEMLTVGSEIKELIREFVDKLPEEDARIVRRSFKPPAGLSAQEAAVWLKMNNSEFEVADPVPSNIFPPWMGKK